MRLTISSSNNRLKSAIIAVFFIFYLTNTGLCQHWQDIAGNINDAINCFYEDTISGNLYIGGSFTKIGGLPIKFFAKWNGLNWDSVPTSSLFFANCITVNALVTHNGELYVGGAKGFSLSRGGLAKWNGTNWVSIGSGTNGIVTSLIVHNEQLYVCGMFDSVGSIQANGLAIWNDSVWSDVHSLPDYFSPNSIVNIEFYKDELYIGGNFSGPDGKIDIARWDGNSWQDVGGGLFGGLSYINDMLIYKDKLYIAGGFSKFEDSRNPGNFIAAWDGNSWSDAGGGMAGIGGVNGQIRDLVIYNGDLYAVGAFVIAGGVEANYIAKWDGFEWCGLGSTFDNILSRIGIYQNMLYIGGGFRTIDGDSINYIAKWTGGSYVDTCGSISGIEKLQSDNNNLKIYPNPFNSTTTLQLQYEMKNGNISIYNIIGKKVKQLDNLNGNEIIISREGLSTGMYFFRVVDGNSIIGQGKMLVE